MPVIGDAPFCQEHEPPVPWGKPTKPTIPSKARVIEPGLLIAANTSYYKEEWA
jgi:hypothetical protein